MYKLIREESNGLNGVKRTFMVSNAASLAEIPSGLCKAGDEAQSADFSLFYVYGMDGQWHSV